MPAAACSPSTFCVMQPPPIQPPRSSSASARCAAFGREREKTSKPMNERAQYRCRFSALRTNSAWVIGLWPREYEPSGLR